MDIAFVSPNLDLAQLPLDDREGMFTCDEPLHLL